MIDNNVDTYPLVDGRSQVWGTVRFVCFSRTHVANYPVRSRRLNAVNGRLPVIMCSCKKVGRFVPQLLEACPGLSKGGNETSRRACVNRAAAAKTCICNARLYRSAILSTRLRSASIRRNHISAVNAPLAPVDRAGVFCQRHMPGN